MQPAPSESMPATPMGPATPMSESCLQARAQAYEEAVSLALYAAAWMEHTAKDARGSAGARKVAHVLAASAGRNALHGPDAFAEARRMLEGW